MFQPLVNFVGGSNGLNGFGEFIYKNIVPATFLAPMKLSFDLNDAQTILVWNNSLMVVAISKHDCVCVTWLHVAVDSIYLYINIVRTDWPDHFVSEKEFHFLYQYMRNFCNLIGLEQ